MLNSEDSSSCNQNKPARCSNIIPNCPSHSREQAASPPISLLETPRPCIDHLSISQTCALKGLTMDRKTFLKSLAATTVTLPCLSHAANSNTAAEAGKCPDAKCLSDANAVRKFLSDFLAKEEPSLSSDTLLKLMRERGRACCRALEFRQKLIDDSAGNIDKLVELMGKIVGPENCRREGDRIILIYPVAKCVCGWSPDRPPSPNDPYCNCSAANNQLLFATVSGKPATVKVVESPRRGGLHCRFDIHLS